MVTETKAVVVKTDFDKAVEAWKASKDDAVVTLVKNIEAYVTKMMPGVTVTKDEGIKQQIRLFRVINNVLNNAEYTVFRAQWLILLAYFYRYSASETGQPKCGVFGERYAFRFTEYWPANDDQMKAFYNIMNLLVVSADPTDRMTRVRKTVDPTNTMKTFFSEQARANTSQFYNT